MYHRRTGYEIGASVAHRFQVQRDGQLIGDFSAEEVAAAAARGAVRPTDLVKRSDRDRWYVADQVKGLFAPEAGPQTTPAQPATTRDAPPTVVYIDRPTRSRTGSSLGIASLVLGSLALIFCWVPFLGVLSIPISAVGAMLAILGLVVALTRAGSGLGFVIGGGALNALALAVAVLITGGIIQGVKQATERAQVASEPPPDARPIATPLGSTDVQELSVDSAAEEPPAPTSGDASTEVATLGPALETAPVPAAISAPSGTVEEQTPEIEWAPHVQLLDLDGVVVAIIACRVGPVTCYDSYSIDGRVVESEERYLAITVQVTNTVETKKLDYLSWRAEVLDERGAKLVDEHGNKYSVMDPTRYIPVGSVKYAPLRPREPARDLLLFERPLDAARTLFLELDGMHAGVEGVYRWQIPTAAIEQAQ